MLAARSAFKQVVVCRIYKTCTHLSVRKLQVVVGNSSIEILNDILADFMHGLSSKFPLKAFV